MRKFCALAGMLLVSVAHAQQWAQEPTTVFGLPIGGSITDEVRCSPNSTSTCIKHGEPRMPPNFGVIEGLPDLGMKVQGSVTIMDGRISAVSLWFAQKDFKRMADILTERYGPPSVETVDTMSNAMGARFDSRTLRWVGPKVILSARERVSRVDQSSVGFNSVELLNQRMQERGNANKDAAGKF